jgi:hypothetical protein
MITYETFICQNCQKSFERSLRNSCTTKKRGSKHFCSKQCVAQHNETKIELKCTNCNKDFTKIPSQIKKTKNHFCCQSCAGTYNNTHKTTGTRRSKFEIHLECLLLESYPNLKFLFNDKTTINSELDIYIPSLKLAFELNGIFHYEPIYGQDKLDQIQNNDNRKFQACLELGIEFCIFDISSIKYFKPHKVLPYLESMKSIIDNKLQREGESNPNRTL